MKKRSDFIWLVAMCLAFVFVLSNFSSAKTEDYELFYKLNEDGQSYRVSGISYNNIGVLTVPAYYEGLPVTQIPQSFLNGADTLTGLSLGLSSITEIKSKAFADCVNLSSLTLSNSLMAIEAYAFKGCSNLKTFNIPNSLTVIGEYAFAGCGSIKNFAVPGGVKTVNSVTFYNCTSLETVSLADGVERINSYAFKNCSVLRRVYIPASVTEIEDGAFDFCYDLSNIEYHGTMEQWNKLQPKSFGSGISNFSVQCTDGTLFTATNNFA